MTRRRRCPNRGSLAFKAYSELREAILQGRFRVGDVLGEEQLAAELEISRTPLREALVRLEQDGLVESVPHRGTFVVGPSEIEAAQITQVRACIEPFAISLAVDAIPTSEIAHVDGIIRSALPELKECNIQLHARCNRELHRLAACFCGNAVLEQMILSMVERVECLHLFSKRVVSCTSMLVAVQEHLAILEAYRQRDAEHAGELMKSHLLSGPHERPVPDSVSARIAPLGLEVRRSSDPGCGA